VTGLLREAGWRVKKKRVERIWRREGLKVPARQPKRGRLWLNDGSCIRLRPERPNHVWAYDFVADRTHEGKAYRMLTVIDEFTRECLAIVVNRKINSHDVLYTLADLFIRRRISGPTPDRNSAPGWYGSCSQGSAWVLCSSSRAVRGRTDTSNRSSGSCGMNYSIGRFSTRSRRHVS